MKRVAILVAALLVAAEAGAATVVLTGGKRLEVAGYTIGGSYVVVQYANGRRESYPLSVVDLQATRDASGVKPAPVAPQPEGPHSPFIGAKSSGGTGGVVVTDADVQHIEETTSEGEGAGETKEKGEEETGTQVTLVSYEKKKISEGVWDIVATVANQGKTAVTGVGAMMRVLDDTGKPVATGSGSFTGTLDPGKQATIVARVTLQGEPFQVAVDLSWREIRPAPAPAATPASPATAPRPQATPAQGSATPSGWTVPAGSPPGTLPSNLMVVPPPNILGVPPQVPRGEPKQ